jgi:hypothetical protein
MRRLLSCAVAVASLLSASVADARDWFVRANSFGGDGSREKPFGDPWMALDRVEAGDKVHVTAGRYYGKLEKGNWEIPFPNVELLGGYDANFKERDPWKNLSELTWRRGSENRPDVSLARISTSTKRDTRGATIDGFFIDMKDYYEYGPDGSFDAGALMRNGAVDLAKGGVLRNCLIVNSISAVRMGPGSTVENNIIVNTIYAAITSKSGGDHDNPNQIRNNTIAFVWATKAIAEGGTEGAGINVTNKAIVENNLIVHSDNHGVQVTVPKKVTFNGNVFWRNLYSNATFYYEGKKTSLDDSDISEAEDAGFAAASGNVAADPKLSFDVTWYEGFLHRPNLGKKFDAKAWEETRASAGISSRDQKTEGFAHMYPAPGVSILVEPKNPAVKAGARAKRLPVSFSAVAAATPMKSYGKTDLASFAANPGAFDGKPIEIVAGVDGVTNTRSFPEWPADTHKAVYLKDAKGENRMVAGFKKGTSNERIIDAIPNYGSGPPRDLFTIRGTARGRQQGYPKIAMFVESIEPYDAGAVAADRPKGRDWFVLAGASGGDGSREKPFRDPFQAIEKAEKGDRILVAEGEYGGKLKSGKWIIDGKQYLSLLGGWDREFKKRDPWNTPSLLQWPPDSKTSPQGYVLEGNGDHTGLIIDGFVFDRRTLNRYDKDGFLETNTSPDNEHIWVASPESAIRNCTFVNGAGAAARISNAVAFENNIVVNVFNDAVKVTGGFGTRTSQIRNNTILFVWNKRRPHDGSSASGSGIVLGGQVPSVVEGNVIQYVDNFGVKADARLNEVTLTNNTFFRNWATFRSTAGMPPPTVDERSMHLLGEMGLRKVDGNQVADANFDIDAAFYAAWHARTSQLTGRFTAEEWRAVARPVDGEVKPGEGMAMDWKKAVKLVPRNDKVRGGARPKKLETGS